MDLFLTKAYWQKVYGNVNTFLPPYVEKESKGREEFASSTKGRGCMSTFLEIALFEKLQNA